jgi:hypothetical protein
MNLGQGELRNMDLDDLCPVFEIQYKVQCISGAWPMVDALNQAQVVITGRVTDTGLTLAPLIHEFGWKANDWDRMSSGTIAVHIIECGAQASGGNCQFEWQNIPDMANVGFPIAEASADGSFVITKHEGSGGRVNFSQ